MNIGFIVLMFVLIFFSFLTGWFVCAFVVTGRICGNFLIDDTDPDKTIYRVELTRDVVGKYAMFEIKQVSNLESASETGLLMKED